ncbi:MAG: right-handed parallel beta-helix repeat-containing protein [Opitutaceae bacterium]|nr:right-handed parallel beta-helix repeat-containing protein [Opitutaceae bacterium]
MKSPSLPVLRQILPLLSLFVATGLSATTVIWVAPTGRDDANGTQERPFATLARARDAVRELVQRGLADDIAIRLRAGTYELRETLELTPDDLGDGRYMVTLGGHKGERAVVTGSRTLPSAWRRVGDNLWALSVPEARNGAWLFRSLFRSGESLRRAREPDEGFYTVAGVGDERRRIILHERLPAAWSNLTGVELNTIAHWHFNRQPVQEIAENGVLARRGIGTDVSSARLSEKSHSRVWLENALVFADTPGEWYLDSTAGELYLRTAPGEDPNQAVFRAPVLRELIVVRGTTERPVSNVQFRDLELAETDWEMPAEGRLGVQAGAWAFDRSRTFSPGAALRFIYARDLRVLSVRFRDLGDGAVSFEIGTRDATVSACDFLRVGSNAVQVGRIPAYTGIGHPMHADFADSRSQVDERGVIPGAQELWDRSQRLTPEAPAQVMVADNTFIDCGHLDYGSVAVCLTYAHHVTIEHNLFRNLPYSAINVGWRWAPGLSNAHSNLIRRNRIDGIVRQAGDGAGVYLVGEQPGTRVLENYVTDSGRNYWSHGIYPDEFSDHMEIAGNYIAGVLDHSIFMHKNGPNQAVHANNGESGPTAINGTTARGTRWSKFSPERTPPDPSLYGPRRPLSP